MTSSSSPDEWRARRAALQAFLREHNGAIGTAELHEIGFSPPAITRLKRDDLIERKTRGVYVGGGATATHETAIRCALLRSGPDSALSRRSAAHWLGHLRFAHFIPQIVVPGQSGFRLNSQLERHCGSNLAEDDVIVHRGERTTSPYRTILDLAADATDPADERNRGVFRWALRSAASDDPKLVPRLRAALDDAPFPGSRILKEQLNGGLESTLVIRSSVEDRFIELCKRFDIPTPTTNAIVLGVERDAWWEQYRAWVEIDTFETHGDEIAFARDRANAGMLARRQIHGFHVTDRRIDHDAANVAADVRGLLGLG